MVGSTVSHYKILEKLGERGPTTLQKMELRRPGPAGRSSESVGQPARQSSESVGQPARQSSESAGEPVHRLCPPKSSFDVGGSSKNAGEPVHRPCPPMSERRRRKPNFLCEAIMIGTIISHYKILEKLGEGGFTRRSMHING